MLLRVLIWSGLVSSKGHTKPKRVRKSEKSASYLFPAPVITEEVNRVVEDVIVQRIKDRAFDDVIHKQKPVEAPLEYKKKLLLDQEKSKQSLAQIYENEYLQQVTAQSSREEREEEEPKLHVEIRTEMQALFSKLDALSNFHFTPKMATADVKIVSNMPAISMEEVAPLAASDAAMLAPEEVRTREKGDTIGMATDECGVGEFDWLSAWS